MLSVERPDIHYAWNGDSSLAYQVVGDGLDDLIYLQGFLSNVILHWEHPGVARFLRRLAEFTRLVVTDRRGLGCSERFTPADIPPIERRNLSERFSLRLETAATSPCPSPPPTQTALPL
jgi:pimeloyl-ACP methyl ester carboxylesterase